MPTVLMALSLQIFLFAYAMIMKNTGNRKEMKKGFYHSPGFQLMVLGGVHIGVLSENTSAYRSDYIVKDLYF